MPSTPEELQAAMAQIDWSNATDVKCAKCECTSFKQLFQIKKLSGLVSPTGQEVIIPMNAFGCNKCGHINEELMMPPPQQ